ncbi:MAG: hypothetical protein OJF59_000613 [Cytophagales bacterium]|jgi:hypothetical protein|nr:MAG: hypothetical protein OJF59_000613 [Cytophagales bacterium]
MKYELPQIDHFNLEISVWKYTFQKNDPIRCSLGEFLSGKIFEDRRIRIHMRDYLFLFQGKEGFKPKIDPGLYPEISKLLDGCSVPMAVKKLQEYVITNGKNEVAKASKLLLPGATISACFKNARRKDDIDSETRILAVDIDNVEDVTQTMQKLKGLMNEDRAFFFWIAKSVTGTGVYALAKCSSSNLEAHFNAIDLILQENGVKADNIKDVTRLRYWSDPNDALFNLEASVWCEEYKLPIDLKQLKSSPQKAISLGGTSAFDTDLYAKSCHKKGLANAANNLRLPEGEIGEHLHVFLKYYHWAFNNYGISIDYAVNWTWDNFFKANPYIVSKGHSIERIRNDFEGFYRSYRLQHHCLDFEKQKESCLLHSPYDRHLKLQHPKKINTLAELPLIGRGSNDNFEPAKDWKGWEKYILDSPTNSGKTSTFTNYFLTNRIKGLILVPTQGALEQIKNTSIDVKLFYEKSKEVTEEDILICSTYNSFKNLSEKINVYDRFLVFDEFHNVVLSASKEFRNFELNYILDRVENFAKVIFMTGTNLKCHHPVFDKFKRVKVSFTNDTEKHLQIVYYNDKNRLSSVMNQLKRFTGRQLIYLDNKQETGGLGKLIEYLKAEGYSDDQIQLVNSDQKQDQQYKNLIADSHVGSEVKVIIATKIFVEALNLYDKVDAFHILTPIHGAYMQQLVTRPRLNQSCYTYLYWHEDNLKSQDPTYWFDQEHFFQQQLKIAEKYLRIFENSEWDKIHKKLFDDTDVIRARRVREKTTDYGFFDEHAGEYVSVYDYDYLNCDFKTQDKQVQVYKKNPEQLYQYLRQYNWKIGEPLISSVQSDKLGNEASKIRKARRALNVDIFIKDLIRNGNYKNMCYLERKIYSEEQWQLQIRMSYMHLHSMLSIQDADFLITKIGANRRAYKTIIEQLRIRFELLNGRSDWRNIPSLIFAEFPTRSNFSCDEVLNKMRGIAKSGIGRIFEERMLKTKTSATQNLGLFVEIERCNIPHPTRTPQQGKKNIYTKGIRILSHHPIRNASGDAIEPIQEGSAKIPTALELYGGGVGSPTPPLYYDYKEVLDVQTPG